MFRRPTPASSILTGATLAVIIFAASIAESVPAFSRRYDLPCHFCHDGYPKLSVLGEQFKERGFRLDDDVSEATDWLKSVPLSFRGGFRQSFEEGADDESLGQFKVLTAGSLGSRVSYWLDQTFLADSDGIDRTATNNAYVRVELVPEELYVKGGRFELDLPFTQIRSPQLFAYDIYFANSGFATESLGARQDGIELGGFLDDATRWSVAIVAGRSTEEQRELSSASDRFDGNVFGRLTRRFGENRVGAYSYLGRSGLARRNPSPDPGGPEVLAWEDDFFRLGGDGSAYLGLVHLYGTFVYGRNANPYADTENPEGTEEPLSFTGGFLQGDVAFRDELTLSARMELRRGPLLGTNGPSETFVGFFPGLKLWLHPRLRLAFELGFRNRDRGTRGAFLVELVL